MEKQQMSNYLRLNLLYLSKYIANGNVDKFIEELKMNGNQLEKMEKNFYEQYMYNKVLEAGDAFFLENYNVTLSDVCRKLEIIPDVSFEFLEIIKEEDLKHGCIVIYDRDLQTKEEVKNIIVKEFNTYNVRNIEEVFNCVHYIKYCFEIYGGENK